MFDAIVRSNGWDDAMVALQLLSHLEGDALNVALLVLEVKRATWAGLVGALTEHYGSPGRLADYQHQFERTTRQEGEDPSTFAVALETLAVKSFGDMSVNTRFRLIQDRFVAELCPATTSRQCSLRETPWGKLLIDVECGRATWTHSSGGL